MVLERTDIERWQPFEGHVVGSMFIHDGRPVGQFANDESRLVALYPVE